MSFRVDLEDHERLKDRAKNAGAKTVSDYVRRAALTGPQVNMPPWEHLRELRNEIINLSAALKTLPPVWHRSIPAKEIHKRILAALERIVKF